MYRSIVYRLIIDLHDERLPLCLMTAQIMGETLHQHRSFFFNARKTKRIAKFDGFEPRRYEDIKAIKAPEIGAKSFGTFGTQAPGRSPSDGLLAPGLKISGVFRYCLSSAKNCGDHTHSFAMIFSSSILASWVCNDFLDGYCYWHIPFIDWLNSGRGLRPIS